MKHLRILYTQSHSLSLAFVEKDNRKRSRGISRSILILCACIFLGTTATRAQITIGSIEDPAIGALLDLKDQLPNAENVTSTTGGLLLPRVKLSNPNDFSLIPNLEQGKKKDYTGLLVYNLKIDGTLSLEKGIYQWDGERWRKLNKITKTENVVVKKKTYSATSPDPKQIVSIGIFEFRMDVRNNSTYPQFRLKTDTTQDSIYWQVNEYWDYYSTSESINLEDNGIGYSFDLKKKKSNDSRSWVDCQNSMTDMERNEIWLADLEHNQMYQIQFIIIRTSINSAPFCTYSIIVKRY
jgi:hypothetical protein